MKWLHVLSLGAFIQGGAHYVHSGVSWWWVVWCAIGAALAAVG